MLRRAAEFFQLLPPLLPGIGIEHANLAILIQFHAGDKLGPKKHPLRVALDRAGDSPAVLPRSVLLSPLQRYRDKFESARFQIKTVLSALALARRRPS